jgi:hypothetical protein
MDVVFKMIGFVIQKWLAAQLVARLPLTHVKKKYNLKLRLISIIGNLDPRNSCEGVYNTDRFRDRC